MSKKLSESRVRGFLSDFWCPGDLDPVVETMTPDHTSSSAIGVDVSVFVPSAAQGETASEDGVRCLLHLHPLPGFLDGDGR